MVFSSITFLFYFLPVVLLLYFVLPWRNAVLLVASLAFYAWGDLANLPILLVYILVNWAAGLAMADPRRRGVGACTIRRTGWRLVFSLHASSRLA